jgi:hypothetical protein
MKRWWRGKLVFLLVPLVPLLQQRIDARVGAHRAQEEVLYLSSGEHLKRLVPGFELLLADLYWVRTVQYFGGQRVFARDKNFALLKPLADITTTLDPRLEIAYRYGAVFLSEPWPAGAGRPRDGIELLAKGVQANPRSWWLRQDLGMFHFVFLHDAQTAARILRESAALPGAPLWLETLAASVLAKGGDRAASREMWARMYEQGEGPIKNNALVHLQRIDGLDAAEKLTSLVARYAEVHGRRPQSLAELKGFGVQGGLVDPAGIEYAYDAATGAVTISRQSPLWRLE